MPIVPRAGGQAAAAEGGGSGAGRSGSGAAAPGSSPYSQARSISKRPPAGEAHSEEEDEEGSDDGGMSSGSSSEEYELEGGLRSALVWDAASRSLCVELRQMVATKLNVGLFCCCNSGLDL
jgi:hypothetical protein